MIELRISGHTVEEFFENLGEMMLNSRRAAEVEADTADVERETATEAVAEANPPVVPPTDPKPKRNTKKKDAPVVDATANPTPAPSSAPAAATTEQQKTAAVSAPPAQDEKLTLDDIRQRVIAIIDAHKERGNEMPAVSAYVMGLFTPYGIKKSSELPEDKWVEFMAKSQGYLDGTVTV